MIAQIATWTIAALAILGVIVRPWKLPEAAWAALGAIAMLALALVPWRDALAAIGKGTDVYEFLVGMMLLAELARKEGLFDWLAALAARQARGSPRRLFALIYGVGIVVTIFLSNDATAVVLTPAVYAAAKAVKAEPRPYLLICAFIANAASFVLPISNPANLVVFGPHMPPLSSWLAQFALPSLLAIGATYAALRFTQRRSLIQRFSHDIPIPTLSSGGRLTAYGIGATGAVLLSASALDRPLGLVTCLAGTVTAVVVLLHEGKAPWSLLKDISWDMLALVAGLFVLVEGLSRTGVLGMLSEWLRLAVDYSATTTTFGAGVLVAIACNLMNNLPVGLIAGSVAGAANLSHPLTGALLIGVDLGPNLSVTGSLATILWLVALRREGQEIGAGEFFRLGIIVMPPALLLALGGFVLLALR